MADKSPIEWTDATWNPIVGCSIATAGCTHCYAMKMAARIEAMGGAPHYAGTTKKANGNAVWTGKLALAPERILTQPLRWKQPRRIFVNSMGDLFHDDVPDEWIDLTLAVMAVTPHHTYQPLTKRADRMRRYLSDPATKHRVYDLACNLVIERQLQVVLIAPGTDERRAPPGLRVYLDQWPLPNVWLGVSAERQQEADQRIPELLATPAAIRFVSAEPLLGPIDFGRQQARLPTNAWLTWLDAIDWIIVGGESGPNARPMHPAWARAIRDQCQTAGVAFFFKQWGEHRPLTRAEHNQACGATLIGNDPHDREAHVLRVGKKAAGRLLDGVEHDGMPEVAGEVPAL